MTNFHDCLGRVSGIAVMDVCATVGASYIVSNRMNWSFWKTTLGMFVLGEGVHVVLGVKTPITKYLSVPV